jgi:protein tyrosine phosphatase
MVWEKKISLIVMLCPVINKQNKEECMNYWNVDDVGQIRYLSAPSHPDAFKIKLL